MAPEKTTQSIVLYTPRHRVEGLVTLLKGERLSDKLNITERKFEAVTEARVYSIDQDKLVHQAPHLAVNKEHITLMLPAGE